ncbi:hypothetical protein [Thermotoga sp. Mc24]|uniref:hypothetical protein n=1 Tax=Thermotoga sp. Mc24 TaxID=1231241 RepID=UPI0012E04018|nr:hypothetical protein [Thermotoga sp. Mc24]
MFELVFMINLIIHFSLNKDLSQTLISIVTYPFGLLVFTKRRKIDLLMYSDDYPEEFSFTFKEKNLEIFPLKGTFLFGTPSEKKKLILQIVNDVESKKIPVKTAVSILQKMVLDPHPDVGLYASEAIGKIESHFSAVEKSFQEIIENLNENNYEVALDYIRSGFLEGKVGSFYKNLLLEKLKNPPDESPGFFILHYEVRGDVSILIEGFLRTKSQEIYRLLLKELLRLGDYKRLNFLLRKSFETSKDEDRDSYIFLS